jgi:hypothetical protein
MDIGEGICEKAQLKEQEGLEFHAQRLFLNYYFSYHPFSSMNPLSDRF